MNFSSDEKVDMLPVYSGCLRNAIKSLAVYQELYPERQPNPRYIQRIEKIVYGLMDPLKTPLKEIVRLLNVVAIIK